MPLFAVIGLDNQTDASSKRNAAMAEHRAYLQAHDERIALVGPLRDQNGISCGSLYLFEAESSTEIRDWLSREPFVRAGVYSNVLIHRFDPVMSRLPLRDWSAGARPRK
jgi:hypothetical protein